MFEQFYLRKNLSQSLLRHFVHQIMAELYKFSTFSTFDIEHSTDSSVNSEQTSVSFGGLSQFYCALVHEASLYLYAQTKNTFGARISVMR